VRVSVALLLASSLLGGPLGLASPADTISLRGHSQVLHVYGRRGGDPVVVLSGDGGWIHLGPHVAEALAARGYFVAGLDARSYLSSFTTAAATLTVGDVPSDMAALIRWASEGSPKRPVLVGVSEGAGLAVLSATDPAVQQRVAGVVALGLPEVSELAWHWTDAWTYLSHRAPNEPLFDVGSILGRVAPVPLAAIYSSHDEFVPLPAARGLFERASEPKQLWIVNAANHRFSNNLGQFDERLLDALAWVRARSTP